VKIFKFLIAALVLDTSLIFAPRRSDAVRILRAPTKLSEYVSMFKKSLFKSIAAAFFFAWAALAIYGQTGKVGLPDTTLGEIAREWFQIVEAGKPDEIERFVNARMSARARRNQPDAARLFRRIHEQSGGLEIVQVTPPAGEYPMSILARSRRGEHFVRVSIGLDATEKDKLTEVDISKTMNPATPKLCEIDESLSEPAMIARIKKEIERRVSVGDFSGVVLIAKDDRVLLETAHGFADVENKILNSPNTKFHLASVGKMFTAVAIAQLVKAGKISYDDSVAKLLTDYPNQEIARKITVRQLLTHTAGMGTFFWSPGYDANRTFRNASEETAVYKDEKLVFEPGARWRYSNAGFSLLGAIIERISGKTYLEYVRANIFKPLGMRDTDTNEPGETAANAAVLYEQAPADPLGIEPFAPNRKIQSSHAAGFGDGSATARDLFRFARAYRTGKLLDAATIEQIAAGKVSDHGKNASRWGYGIQEKIVNNSVVRGHSGGGRTDVQTLWASGYTVIVQTNKIPPSANVLSNEIIAFLTKQLEKQNKSAAANDDKSKSNAETFGEGT
jgi:CubicO group peptidase (beta-lactamase class C family)